MKRIVILASVLAIAVGTALGQDDEGFRPMKGSATPEFESSNAKGDRCLVFGKNVVKTKLGEVGEEIRLWHREGTAKGMEACSLRAKPYATIADEDNNSFYGISAVYFFIDQGTGVDSRTLVVYKTGAGDEVTRVDYFGGGESPRIEAARYLYYDVLSNKKGTVCKDAAKWKRQGGSVGWVQGKKMDLDDQTIANVGTLHCAYVE